jgi:hypothetical protein
LIENSVFNDQVRARSEEDADDELSSVVVLKNGKKVVCGSQLGVLTIFSWGHFADCSDRLPGNFLHFAGTLRYRAFIAEAVLST